MKVKNSGNIRNRITYTILVVILLSVVFVTMINYVYHTAENSNSETLHTRTKEIKDDITLQMISDRENLFTIASMAENLYSQRGVITSIINEQTITDIVNAVKPIYEHSTDFSILFDSFESIGLIDEIAILLPGNTLITKRGVGIAEGISYSDEVKKAPYISGKVPALTGEARDVIRSSVPIVVDGKSVGVLYGIIELDTIKNKYIKTVDNMNARLYLIERGNGDFILDTWSTELGNLKDSKVLENKSGYSYDEMRKDIFAGGKGFCAYKSNISKVFMYTHYSPMDFGDWTIVLSMPESIVFKEAHELKNSLMLVFALVLVIMALYVTIMFVSEKKYLGIGSISSKIRKHLLGVAGDKKGVEDALKLICEKCHGRTTFFLDNKGNDFCYTEDAFKDIAVSGESRGYFQEELYKYIQEKRTGPVTTIWVCEVMSELKISKTNPEFYRLLKEYDVRNIYIAAISDRNDKVSVLGVINTKRKFETKEILKEVAVCFSISIGNKDHLDRTEYEAVTDALTGISNRVAYKRDIVKIEKDITENFACIYIDVNELHTYNNKYGHAAGDEMLIYIANAIKAVFGEHYMYRMGGDEFLIFTFGISEKEVELMIKELVAKVEEKGYHISVGMEFTSKNIDTESALRLAEKKMYDEKAKYYQRKERLISVSIQKTENKFFETGNSDLDNMTKLLQGHYNGIYYVNLNTDVGTSVAMPLNINVNEKEQKFSEIFKEYVNTYVHNDSQRGMFRFLNYDVLKDELDAGEIPKITYRKTNGESRILTVYSQGEKTLWVFEDA